MLELRQDMEEEMHKNGRKELMPPMNPSVVVVVPVIEPSTSSIRNPGPAVTSRSSIMKTITPPGPATQGPINCSPGFSGGPGEWGTGMTMMLGTVTSPAADCVSCTGELPNVLSLTMQGKGLLRKRSSVMHGWAWVAVAAPTLQSCHDKQTDQR